MKRAGMVVGLIALIALITGAFAVRAARHHHVAVPPVPTRPVLLCTTDMRAVCSDLASGTLDVRIESPAVTIGRLRDGETLGADAWLAARPWIDLAQIETAAAGRADPFGAATDTLARTPLVVIVRRDRRAVLEGACAGRIDWPCLTGRVGQPWAAIDGTPAWGLVTLGLDQPDEATDGLLAIAQMTAAFTRRATFDVRDLETVQSSLTTLASRVPASSHGDALGAMLERDGSFDLTVTLEAGTRVAIASPRASGQLDLIEINPVVAADAVLVAGIGSLATVDPDGVRKALIGRGWHFPDRAASGVPDGATLRAILQLWQPTR